VKAEVAKAESVRVASADSSTDGVGKSGGVWERNGYRMWNGTGRGKPAAAKPVHRGKSAKG
jgi:hypothetical protein